MNAKAKLVLGSSSIEIEGSEEFVERNLSWFKTSVPSEPIHLGSNDNQEVLSKQSTATANKAPKKLSEASQGGQKPKKTKLIQAERFDIYKGTDRPSLEDFLVQKQPGEAAGNRIVVIAYYIIELLKVSTFTEGNIEYAYKTLNLKNRPTHLRQIIINLKNERDWFEQDEASGTWRLTRSGEIFVSEKLPLKNEP